MSEEGLGDEDRACSASLHPPAGQASETLPTLEPSLQHPSMERALIPSAPLAPLPQAPKATC